MFHLHHKYCRVGEQVEPDYFYPPTPVMHEKPMPVLQVIAFAPCEPNQSIKESIKMLFTRVNLGEPWSCSKIYEL